MYEKEKIMRKLKNILKNICPIHFKQMWLTNCFSYIKYVTLLEIYKYWQAYFKLLSVRKVSMTNMKKTGSS